jgi:hypothetical protein
MQLNIEARVPKLETLTYDCLKELKTISKTLIEIEKLKRLKLKPKQHVFPWGLQGANREAIKMYDQIQQQKLTLEQADAHAKKVKEEAERRRKEAMENGPNPEQIEDCRQIIQEQREKQQSEFPAELVPKDSFDDVYAKMTDEEKLASNQRCAQCIQSDKDTCNPTIGQPEADKPINHE